MTHSTDPIAGAASRDGAVPTAQSAAPRLTAGRMRLLGCALAVLTAVFALFVFLPWPNYARAYLGDDIAAVANSLALALIIGTALGSGAYSPSRVWVGIGLTVTIALSIIAVAQAMVGLLRTEVPDSIDALLPMISLVLFWIASFGVLLVGSWHGPARLLPFALGSWPVPVFGIALLMQDLETTAWLVYISYVLLGLLLNSAVLILDARRLTAPPGGGTA